MEPEFSSDLEVDALTDQLTQASLLSIPNEILRDKLISFERDNPLKTVIDFEDNEILHKNLQIHRYCTIYDDVQDIDRAIFYFEFGAKSLDKDQRIESLVQAVESSGLRDYDRMASEMRKISFLARVIGFSGANIRSYITTGKGSLIYTC